MLLHTWALNKLLWQPRGKADAARGECKQYYVLFCADLPCGFLGGVASQGFSLYAATFETPMLTLGGEGPGACEGRILLYDNDGEAKLIGGYTLRQVSKKDF
jgi:hypothetical protein